MIDKVKVARSFSRSAATYDQVAYFQRDVGLVLLRLLSKCINPASDLTKTKESENYCIDIGCGTGFFKDRLEALLPEINYIGLDLAEGMLRHLRAASYSGLPGLLCADAEKMPLADNSAAYLFSNMALQWCEDLPGLFAEMHRVLMPGGVFALTTLGPKTLYELKQAWAKVDDLVHVNHFLPFEQWQRAIEQNQFTVESQLKKETVLQYSSVKTLLQELKLLGAHNLNEGQRQSLTGPKRLQSLLNSYQREQSGLYSATYDVYYWVLKKV